MNEEIESLLLQLDNHSLVVTVIEVSHGATLVTVCLTNFIITFVIIEITELFYGIQS